MYDVIILTDTQSKNRIKPLGGYLIASSLRKNNFNVLVIDYFSHMGYKNLESILKKVISDKTLFVGYSASLLFISQESLLKENYFLDFNFYQLNKLIKDLNPKTKIIFGGACSKNIWQYNLEYNDNLGINYVMHGYSEKMILDFAISLKNNKTPKFNNVHNKLYEINYDFKGEQYEFNKSYHIWHDTDFVRKHETLPLEISRGCIFKCKFCSYPLLGKNPNDNSYYKSEKNLLFEILYNYQKYKTLNYFVLDDTFNERIDKIEMMLRIRDKSKLDLNFIGYNRLELISRKSEQISLLKDLNFTGHYLGIETFNYPSAKIIGKGIKLEEIRETIDKMRTVFNNRISITVSLILGLPKETPELFQKNTEWLWNENSGVDSVMWNPLSLSYNTHSESEFFKNPIKYGYFLAKDGTWISDSWTQLDAIKTAEEYTNKFRDLGFQKITTFRSAILAGFHGFNYFDLIKTKLKDLDEQKTNNISEFYINNYVTNLKKILKID